MERATHESAPFRFVAGNLHPDHDTLASFRKPVLADLEGHFVQILLIAQEVGVLQLGRISLDGSKLHTDVSQSKAVSNRPLQEIEEHLQAEVDELFALGE
jgi:transposase